VSDTVISVLLILAIFVVLPIMLLSVRDRIWREKPDPEAGAKLKHRLENPRVDAIERRTRKKVPTRLVQLYQDPSTLDAVPGVFRSPSPSDKVWSVAFFNPLDEITLDDYSGPDMYSGLTGTCFAFADDGCGNCFYVPLSDIASHDAPVYFYDHETDESELVCSSLDEFLSWPRSAS
jgi:hypothetical protein